MKTRKKLPCVSPRQKGLFEKSTTWPSPKGTSMTAACCASSVPASSRPETSSSRARALALPFGWDRPPDLASVNDPWGLALILGLMVKEVPFLLLAGIGAIVFFLATAFLLGREYFYLAAMRFHAVPAARMLRATRSAQVSMSACV